MRPTSNTKRVGLAVMMAIVMGGCAQPRGVVFPAVAGGPSWPPPPEPARVVYVGQLTTDADLKPGKPFGRALGEALFGKNERHSMLTPYALCTDGGTRLFVADSNAQVVHVFDTATRKYTRWAPPGPGKKEGRFAQPVGIAWDGKRGRLLVSDSVAGVIHSFDTAGQHVGEIGKDVLKRPCGIAVDPATHHIYVADAQAHQVVVLSVTGQELARLGERGNAPGTFNFPINLALDAHGMLYVSDALNFRVQQFDADLKFVRQIGKQGDMPGYFSQPKGLAVDRENHLYVVDARFEAVQVFDDRGTLLMTFGEEGTAPGEFWLPAGIFIDPNNRIWVADTYNRRVQVFDYIAEVAR